MESGKLLIQSEPNVAGLLQLAASLQATLLEGISTPSHLLASKIRSVLLASNLLDDGILREFNQAVGRENGLRLALADLFERFEAPANDLLLSPSDAVCEWLVLVTAACAEQKGYDIENLDPSSPPAPHSPAGLMLAQVADFFKAQTRRTATERDRLAKKLAFDNSALSETSQESSADPAPAAADPDVRVPAPVTYFEHNPPIKLTVEDIDQQHDPVTTLPPVSLDLTAHPPTPEPESEPAAPAQPQTMPAIKITRESLKPLSQRVTEQANQAWRDVGAPAIGRVADKVRDILTPEETTSTMLRVQVLDQPQGAGIVGVQVTVTCKGIRSHVAGITDRDGSFICELPVRESSGLTYDVTVSWPREMGSDREKKSITLSPDRGEFELPFFRSLA
ncbi:MAG: carboxypeptidase-like regulatory domain-containing protein [Chloroflexota bacterium]